MKEILLVTILLFSAPAASPGQTTLFGGVGRGAGAAHRGELIRIDQTTGTGALVGAGATDPNAGLTGLAFASSGQLFATTINAPIFDDAPTTPVSTLIRLDPFTGQQVVLIGPIRLADGTSVVINDLALQPGTDVLFGTALNDTGTNTSTPSTRPPPWPRSSEIQAS